MSGILPLVLLRTKVMEFVVFLPVLIGVAALFRAGYIVGWSRLASQSFQPKVPGAIKVCLVGFLALEALVGSLWFGRVIDVSIARLFLSPVTISLVVTVLCGWVLVANWGEGRGS